MNNDSKKPGNYKSWYTTKYKYIITATGQENHMARITDIIDPNVS
jgi:hypothetical protein